jgi:crotonobetainyl-CoA:carnitine CoA-transferase CaiB-like acyl-CoA transferase
VARVNPPRELRDDPQVQARGLLQLVGDVLVPTPPRSASCWPAAPSASRIRTKAGGRRFQRRPDGS